MMFLFFLPLSLGINTGPLHSYHELTAALLGGCQVRFAADYNQCNPSPGKAIGGDQIQNFRISAQGTADEVLTFADAKLITNYQGSGYVYDYVLASVTTNQTVKFLATDLYTNTFKPVYEEEFSCQIFDGTNGAVSFFATQCARQQPLSDLDGVMAALKAGQTVQVVTDYSKCDGGKQGVPPVFEGLALTTFEYFNDPRFFPQAFVGWNFNQLNRRTGNYTYELAEFTLEKQTANVSVTALAAATLEKQSSDSYVCTVGKGINFHAIPFKTDPTDQLALFRSFIVGHFSNAKQVELDNKLPEQIRHPFAEHISDVANQKMINCPKSMLDGGFFVLEESYYTNTSTGQMTPSPFLFYFDSTADNNVRISAYTFPKSVPPEQLRNNNTALKLDFSQMTLSDQFKPSIYSFSAGSTAFKSRFALNSITPTPGNGTFTLIEDISAYSLQVMEVVQVAGQKVFPPYLSPIEYDRL